MAGGGGEGVVAAAIEQQLIGQNIAAARYRPTAGQGQGIAANIHGRIQHHRRGAAVHQCQAIGKGAGGVDREGGGFGGVAKGDIAKAILKCAEQGLRQQQVAGCGGTNPHRSCYGGLDGQRPRSPCRCAGFAAGIGGQQVGRCKGEITGAAINHPIQDNAFLPCAGRGAARGAGQSKRPC